MTDVKKVLVRQIWEVLREDILTRYDNSEYWDFELDAIADLLSGLNEKERLAVLRLVGY